MRELVDHNIIFDPDLCELKAECAVCRTIKVYKNRVLLCAEKGCGQIPDNDKIGDACKNCGHVLHLTDC